MIGRHANVATNLATVGKRRLIKQSGIGKRTVDKAIIELEQQGHLICIRHREADNRLNDENMYQLILKTEGEIPF